jgi:hypothetical protein
MFLPPATSLGRWQRRGLRDDAAVVLLPHQHLTALNVISSAPLSVRCFHSKNSPA